jgi:hypothetical protein
MAGVGAQKLHIWGQLCTTTPSSSEFVEMRISVFFYRVKSRLGSKEIFRYFTGIIADLLFPFSEIPFHFLTYMGLRKCRVKTKQSIQ